MANKDKVKKALLLCSEKDCKNCPYNSWIYGVCQKYLFRDAMIVICELDNKIDNKLDNKLGGKDYGYKKE